MMDQSIVYFAQDFVEILYERAKEARESCKQLEHDNTDPDKVKFECGRALAYYEVISLFISQARTFGVLETFTTLTDVEPDQLLS